MSSGRGPRPPDWPPQGHRGAQGPARSFHRLGVTWTPALLRREGVGRGPVLLLFSLGLRPLPGPQGSAVGSTLRTLHSLPPHLWVSDPAVLPRGVCLREQLAPLTLCEVRRCDIDDNSQRHQDTRDCQTVGCINGSWPIRVVESEYAAVSLSWTWRPRRCSLSR